jgi:hypothetical protein
MLVRKPSAFLPLGMSSIALLLILVHVATVGVQRQADEGAEARLWQLLMLGQLPFIAYFGIRWLPQAPRQGVMVLLMQLALAVAAALPVFLLEF